MDEKLNCILLMKTLRFDTPVIIERYIIEASLNKLFTITLNALPTAGDTWTAKYDSHFLKLENERILKNGDI